MIMTLCESRLQFSRIIELKDGYVVVLNTKKIQEKLYAPDLTKRLKSIIIIIRQLPSI